MKKILTGWVLVNKFGIVPNEKGRKRFKLYKLRKFASFKCEGQDLYPVKATINYKTNEKRKTNTNRLSK